MLEAHEQATGVAPTGHPKHLHRINKMLQAVHHGHGRRALLQSQQSKDDVAAGRAGSVARVLSGVGSAVAGRLLAGEEAEYMESSQFTMEVQQFTSSTLEGAVVGSGQVQVPAGQNLSRGDVSTHTVGWRDNPYGAVSGSQSSEDSRAALSSQVFSVTLMSGLDEIPVTDLQETFNITLRRSALNTTIGLQNNSNGSGYVYGLLTPKCSSLSCINTYDVAHGSGACLHALQAKGYSCEEHFCPDCELAGFCDRLCAPGCNTTNTSNTSAVDSRVNDSTSTPECILDPSPSCAYWDVSINGWRTDGSVINMTDTTITCAFRHLTDFGAMLSPPAQTAELASLSDTFDLAAFALENPVGLAVSVMLFCCLIMVAFQSLRDVLRVRKTRNVRHRIKTDVVSKRGRSHEYGQKFALWGKDTGIVLGDRIEKMLPTRLRSDYLCGSFWFGLKGEPFDKWQRLLVVICTFLLTLMVNVYFFQSKRNQKELCEGPMMGGRPTNCSGDVSQQTLCQCRTFDCGVLACEQHMGHNCSRCDTIDNCAVHCPILESNRIVQTFVTILLTWPIGSLLLWLFEWLHRPYVQMVESELELARESERLALIRRRHVYGGYRRYGREQRKAGGRSQHATSDVAGDEASQLWTESGTGQEEVRMEEEAAEVHKEEWEKQPIMSDGRIPCEECGDRNMYPLAMIQRYDYQMLERMLENEQTEPSYERIMEMYDEKQLCCILHNHSMSYSYGYKNGLQNLQQSKAVMAWQVHRMIGTAVNASTAQQGRERSRSRSRTMQNTDNRIFTRKDGTNWEHAIEDLKLSNPGRSVANRQKKGEKNKRRRKAGKAGKGVCPRCKGTGASGLVWFATGRAMRDGKMRSEYIAVTPGKRRVAMKASARTNQLDRRRRSKSGTRRTQASVQSELPQLDDVADRRHKTFGQWDIALPYVVGLAVGIACVIQISRTVRNFSSPRTVEWISSSIVSLVLSWTLTDPLKVVVTTPFMAWLDHRKVEKRTKHLSKAHARLQGLAFMGGGALGRRTALSDRNKKGLAKFRNSAKAIAHVATALDTKQRRILKAEVHKFEQKHRQELAARHAQEQKDLDTGRPASRQFSSKSEARAGLQEKHQLERQHLDKKMQIMDDDLHNILNGQHEKFYGSIAPSDQSQLQSRSLMGIYNTEANRLQEQMDTKKRKDQDDLQAKIAEKRRQMAERISSVERLLHVNALGAHESVAQRAANQQARHDEVAAVKKQLSDATAKMERVLWANRHATPTGTAGAPAQGAALVGAPSMKRTLADDVEARKTGQYIGDELGPKSQSDEPSQEIEAALDIDSQDTSSESRSAAARRWNDLSAWQARVAALASLHAEGPVNIAEVMRASTAKTSAEAAEATARWQRNRLANSAKTEPRSTSVSFKLGQEDEVMISQSAPRVLPRPPSTHSAGSPSPSATTQIPYAPGSAASKTVDSAALRASIAMARTKLAAKKRRARGQDHA